MRVKVADIEIDDVPITVAFAEGDPGPDGDTSAEFERYREAIQGDARSSEFALIWRGENGSADFLAGPQLHLFFERVQFDQLAAQVTREVWVD